MSLDLTIIIKTFERVESLTTLLESIRKRASGYKIIIADDSKCPYGHEITSRFPELPITYLSLPFDSGLSHGRNAMLEHVDTDYFLLCDDDFCFDDRTNLDVAIEILRKEELDILGGIFYNYRTISKPYDYLARTLQVLFTGGQPNNFMGELSLDEGTLTVACRMRDFPEFTRVDFCHNFFLAKTGPLKKMGGWLADFKIQEHIAFFLKVKQHGLKVGFSNRFGVRHYPVRRKHYAAFRFRSSTAKLFTHYHLHTSVRRHDNGETLVERLTPSGIRGEYVFAPTLWGTWRKFRRRLKV